MSTPLRPAGFGRFVAAMWRLMPRRISASLVLSLAVSAFEAAGVLVLVELLGIVGVGLPQGAVGTLGEGVRAALAAVGARPTLGGVLLLYLGLTVVQALIQRAQTLVSWGLEMALALHLRRRLYLAIAETRWLHFTRVRASDLVQALTTEAERAASAGSYLLTMAGNGLVALVYLGFALRVSAVATLVSLLCGGVLMWALRRQGWRAADAGREVTAAMGDLVSAATEHLGGMKAVKSHGAEERTVEIFSAAARRTAAMHLRSIRAYADSRALFTIGSMALLAGVTYVAVEGLGLPGGVVLLLVFLFARLVPRLQGLQGTYQQVLHDLPAWENLRARLEALEAERERLSPVEGVHALAEGVRFEEVAFAYPGVERDAASGLSFEIEARRTTALVGPSGSGKSTVADLVMGLVRPKAGRIVVDGRTLDESWMRGWREGIGYVAQETVLFHDTVLANLRWAQPEATEAEAWDALRAAAAEEFVRALPDGLETVLGDRGVRLSGGERQRLALARALLRRPALLILDEATSALDPENERRIRDAIEALHGRVTILLITHRLSSVRDADAIHVMESGRIVESGDWPSLLARPTGRFRDLWRVQ
ncbi:MAG TPA: ABC transporter ATP-binding protein, partial [Longimicrobium sp.]|nr:ABC transporter ATP-binding protein [Longimicrobium sp.]